MEKQLVTLVSGHQMFKTAYNQRQDHIQTVFEQHGAKVTNKCKPSFGYDFSYIIRGIKELPREVYTKLAQAGLKAEVKPTSFKQLLVRLVYW